MCIRDSLNSPLNERNDERNGDDKRLKQFLLANRGERLQQIADWLQPRLTEALVERNFTGYFGVDALVCTDAKQELKVKPLVELNPRMTMGHIALNLKKRLAPGTEAEFRILTRAQWEQAKPTLETIEFTSSADGRWKGGTVWLCEVNQETKLVPVVLVGKEAIATVS